MRERERERERDDHMVVIKHLGKVEGQTKIYLQLFGYAKRHEEKRHGSKLFKESVTWQNLILSRMRSLLLYIYIYIYINCIHHRLAWQLKKIHHKCFLRTQKQLTTLRMGEVCVWAKNLSKDMELERRSMGKTKRNV